ncbi:AbrB/MazE/SpoVT family DNA-binding domain-containing protein [Leptolyngbya sp. FACHB-671]|jgi:AbrB family looped-hinge helix DNA binding protein|uniref:AbrB/MazE/SpoVT family DNA-binding domain-containing protein n=1 Tax=Leptolyngbya sp. FACHB-671 TaxID=2692812 RepID=UPI0016892D54|nr:AbrB/MazE/SpoVT family DNA-binding domain-containing protein [Leptolyngbya sp. FACHB-671]MBD2070253.1 AbrB/MazE/SpoVT family DNA-binding domain-containing protein [Leptolyngbya sp. FACHB-671]
MTELFSETSKLGKRGTLVIPAKLRQRFGLKEGSLVITEETAEGILLRPAVAVPTTSLTQEQIEELLLEGINSGESTDIVQQDSDDLRQAAQKAKKS